MDSLAIQRTVSRGLYELSCEDEFAAMVARLKGWTGSPKNWRRRIWQALSETDERNFDVSLLLLAQRLFAYHERTDLCDELVGALMAARWEGERARQEEPVREMRKVLPPTSAGLAQRA